MKKNYVSCLLGIASLVMAAVPASADNETLRYVTPARWMEEALMIGNGNLGAAVYGGIDCDSLSLNDLTLWTGEPATEVFAPEAYKAIPEIRTALDRGDFRAADSLLTKVQGRYSQNYQPLGRLYIRNLNAGADVTDFTRTLDLGYALASTSFTDNGTTFVNRYYASAPDSVIVAEISANGPTPLDVEISLSTPLVADITSDGGRITSDGYAAYYSRPIYSGGPGSHRYDPDRGIHFSTIVAVEAPDSKITSVDGKIRIEGGHRAWVYLTNATSFNGFDRDPVKEGKPYRELAQKRIEKVMASKPDDVLGRHIADYRKLYSRVELDLGDTDPAIAALPTDVQLLQYTDLNQNNPDLEELYFNFGRYLLISCSRTPGVPANLQGLWNEYLCPPWSSNYTTNINLEENYWPAESANLPELHMPLMDFIVNLSKTGRDAAQYYYGVDRGWCLGQNSDIWALTPPVGEHGGHPSWANWTLGGAWLASHIWQHYLFTGDKEFLAEYYPALKGAAEFCIDWLVDKDGVLVTSPGTSPENRFVAPDGYVASASAGSTADLAMTRECLMDAAAAAEVLGVDEDLRREIAETLPRLKPYAIGSKGNLMEWPEDYEDIEPTHRHQSHLYGVFPGNHITPTENPDLIAAAHKSLELRGTRTTGWSTGWRINLYARMLDAASAYSTYRMLLKYISPDGYKGEDARRGGGTYPNLLDAHSPFQIDGNFGGTSGVVEMLLQSTPETITILPALPAAWTKGSVKGLKARGAYEVDITWDGGKPTQVVVRSINGGSPEVVYAGQSHKLTLAPGEEQMITF